MLSDKSLERTVNHSGRTVRAVALCARAGAQWRSWPAVQRNHLLAMNRATAIIWAILTITVAVAQTVSLDDSEQLVLAKAIAARLKGSEKWLLIANDTATLRCDGKSMMDVAGCNGGMRTKEQRPEDILAWLHEQFPQASPELLVNFRVKSEYPATVGRPFPLALKQVIWGRVGDGWGTIGGEALPKDNPDYLIIVSRAGFDPGKSEALVYVGAMSWESSKLSYGEYLYLVKGAESWSVAGRARMWDMPPK